MKEPIEVFLRLLWFGAAPVFFTPACTITAISSQGDAGSATSTNGADASTVPDAAIETDASAAMSVQGGPDAGAGGSSSDAPANGSDPCGTAESANDDPGHATPFVFGGDFHACLQTDKDIDFYRITSPVMPAQGGGIVVQVNDVGASGNIDLLLLGTTNEQAAIYETSTYTQGASRAFWFNAAPATSYLVEVKPFAVASQTPYTLRIDFTGVPDDNEPNDSRDTATPLVLGTPVHGYLFSAPISHSVSTPWDDWYKISLPAGNTTFALTDLAGDVNAQFFLYEGGDSGSPNAVLANPSDYNDGAAIRTSRQVAAGDYYVDVQVFSGIDRAGSGASLPGYDKTPYTFTVTQ